MESSSFHCVIQEINKIQEEGYSLNSKVYLSLQIFWELKRVSSHSFGCIEKKLKQEKDHIKFIPGYVLPDSYAAHLNIVINVNRTRQNSEVKSFRYGKVL